jgi:hypothetical protein
MIRHLRWICLAIACSGCVVVSDASDAAYPFVFEIRIPKDVRPDLKTEVSLVAYRGEDGTMLSACKQSEEGAFLVFQGDFLLFTEDKPQRGLVVTLFPSLPDALQRTRAQVFRLSIPKTPKPSEWSQWKRPNYIEIGDAGPTFSYPDSKVPGRSTNIPPICFELRYKIGSKQAD